VIKRWHRKDDGGVVKGCLARNRIHSRRLLHSLDHDSGAGLDLLGAVGDVVGYVLVHGELAGGWERLSC